MENGSARAHEPADICTVYDRPIAPDFDAVLLYDMPRTITDVQQQHFLALFERGVEVVVLHHALAGLQQWNAFEGITGLCMREEGDVRAEFETPEFCDPATPNNRGQLVWNRPEGGHRDARHIPKPSSSSARRR
jgi:hypothetical protein